MAYRNIKRTLPFLLGAVHNEVPYRVGYDCSSADALLWDNIEGIIMTNNNNQTKVSIMEDKGAWQFTDDTIVRIKQGDTAAIAEFYNTNYTILTKMARKYVWIQHNLFRNYLYEFDDLMQQVYVDIPYYDYSSRSHLYCNILRGSFSRLLEGGILSAASKHLDASRIISYDTPVMDKKVNISDSLYLLDIIASSPDAYEVMIKDRDREEKDRLICDFLERTLKNPRDLNAMWCRLFTDIPLNQIKGDEYEYYKQCAV